MGKYPLLKKWLIGISGTIIGGLLLYGANWSLDQLRSKSKDIRILQKEVAVLKAQRENTKEWLSRFDEASKHIYKILGSHRKDRNTILVDVKVLKKIQNKILAGSNIKPEERTIAQAIKSWIPEKKKSTPDHREAEDKAMRSLKQINIKGDKDATRKAINQFEK